MLTHGPHDFLLQSVSFLLLAILHHMMRMTLQASCCCANIQVRSNSAAASPPVQTTDPSASLLTKVSITGNGLQSTAARRSRFSFYVDDNCHDVAEVLLHAWLKLLGLPSGACHLAEALLAKRASGRGLQLPHRIQQEVASMLPMQVAEVSHHVSVPASELNQHSSCLASFMLERLG